MECTTFDMVKEFIESFRNDSNVDFLCEKYIDSKTFEYKLVIQDDKPTIYPEGILLTIKLSDFGEEKILQEIFGIVTSESI